jgi:hypothetical protein
VNEDVVRAPPAYHLVARVSGEFLGGLVPVGYSPIEVQEIHAFGKIVEKILVEQPVECEMRILLFPHTFLL